MPPPTARFGSQCPGSRRSAQPDAPCWPFGSMQTPPLAPKAWAPAHPAPAGRPFGSMQPPLLAQMARAPPSLSPDSAAEELGAQSRSKKLQARANRSGSPKNEPGEAACAAGATDARRRRATTEAVVRRDMEDSPTPAGSAAGRKWSWDPRKPMPSLDETCAIRRADPRKFDSRIVAISLWTSA